MKLRALTLASLVLMLAGCSAEASQDTATPTPTIVAIEADSIRTINEGIAWARSLDESVSAKDLSIGIQAIGDLVPGEDIWFERNNEIGSALIGLNNDVLNAPATAETKVDDLNAIMDDLEEAIAHGDFP